jgi:hypothetical protein
MVMQTSRVTRHRWRYHHDVNSRLIVMIAVAVPLMASAQASLPNHPLVIRDFTLQFSSRHLFAGRRPGMAADVRHVVGIGQ